MALADPAPSFSYPATPAYHPSIPSYPPTIPSYPPFTLEAASSSSYDSKVTLFNRREGHPGPSPHITHTTGTSPNIASTSQSANSLRSTETSYNWNITSRPPLPVISSQPLPGFQQITSYTYSRPNASSPSLLRPYAVTTTNQDLPETQTTTSLTRAYLDTFSLFDPNLDVMENIDIRFVFHQHIYFDI